MSPAASAASLERDSPESCRARSPGWFTVYLSNTSSVARRHRAWLTRIQCQFGNFWIILRVSLSRNAREHGSPVQLTASLPDYPHGRRHPEESNDRGYRDIWPWCPGRPHTGAGDDDGEVGDAVVARAQPNRQRLAVGQT